MITVEEAWQKHRKRVRSIVWRMVRNDSDADDLVQEVFLQLHRKIHLFRGDSAFTTWLHRLTVNVVLMKCRRRTVQEESLDALEDASDETGRRTFQEAIATRDVSVETVAERAQLDAAIAALPSGYRTVLILHDIEGLEHHEIADLLGTSIGNSKSQLAKARAALREMFDITAEDDGEPEGDVDAAIAGLEAFL